MRSAIASRVSRLEKAVGSLDDELVEFEFSDEAKDVLRAVLMSFGTITPEDIEATVNERQLLPRPCRLELSPARRAQPEKTQG